MLLDLQPNDRLVILMDSGKLIQSNDRRLRNLATQPTASMISLRRLSQDTGQPLGRRWNHAKVRNPAPTVFAMPGLGPWISVVESFSPVSQATAPGLTGGHRDDTVTIAPLDNV